MPRLKIKRVYEAPEADDGFRMLIDRLWPRGLKKELAELDEWNKDIAPSPELRTWFGHRPERFDEFARRYRDELHGKYAELERIRDIARRSPLTLLYAARDPAINHAQVLLNVLSKQTSFNHPKKRP